MGRRSIPDTAERTIRLHIPTYNSILQFFGESPTGIKGSDAIREVVYQFGLHCQEQMAAGQRATAVDYGKIEQIVKAMFAPTRTEDDEEDLHV